VPTIPFFISATLKDVYYMHDDGGAFKKKSDSFPRPAFEPTLPFDTRQIDYLFNRAV
jgi:hypothetical protein